MPLLTGYASIGMTLDACGCLRRQAEDVHPVDPAAGPGARGRGDGDGEVGAGDRGGHPLAGRDAGSAGDHRDTQRGVPRHQLPDLAVVPGQETVVGVEQEQRLAEVPVAPQRVHGRGDRLVHCQQRLQALLVHLSHRCSVARRRAWPRPSRSGVLPHLLDPRQRHVPEPVAVPVGRSGGVHAQAVGRIVALLPPAGVGGDVVGPEEERLRPSRPMLLIQHLARVLGDDVAGVSRGADAAPAVEGEPGSGEGERRPAERGTPMRPSRWARSGRTRHRRRTRSGTCRRRACRSRPGAARPAACSRLACRRTR